MRLEHFGRRQGDAGWVRADQWPLTSLQQRLVKTGGRLIKHARYYSLLLAESRLTRRPCGGMLQRIAAFPSPAGQASRRPKQISVLSKIGEGKVFEEWDTTPPETSNRTPGLFAYEVKMEIPDMCLADGILSRDPVGLDSATPKNQILVGQPLHHRR